MVPIATNVNFLPTISIDCQEIRLWELIKWSSEKNALIFSQILSTNSLRECIEISLENLYVDNGASIVNLPSTLAISDAFDILIDSKLHYCHFLLNWIFFSLLEINLRKKGQKVTYLLSEKGQLVINGVIPNHPFFNQWVDLCRQLLDLQFKQTVTNVPWLQFPRDSRLFNTFFCLILSVFGPTKFKVLRAINPELYTVNSRSNFTDQIFNMHFSRRLPCSLIPFICL